jgi:hypothetical protein
MILLVDDLSTSTSHASDFELYSIGIKSVIIDTAYLEIFCLNNHVMPKSKESGTQGKFVPTCHNCEKIDHIRPNCYLLKSHRFLINQDVLRKCKVEDTSSSKYVNPYRRHIKGKNNVICKLAHLSSLRHHRSHPTHMSTAPSS